MSRPFRWIGTVVTSGGIPVAAILVLLLTVIMQVILQKTVLGYHARGIGVNAEIAEIVAREQKLREEIDRIIGEISN